MAQPAAKFWQDKFDPAATLVVAAWPSGFTHKGRAPRRGEILDKSGVAPNILRAMYESRWVRMAEPHEIPPSVSPSPTGNVTQTTGEPSGESPPATAAMGLSDGTEPDPKAAYAEKLAAEGATAAPPQRKRK